MGDVAGFVRNPLLSCPYTPCLVTHARLVRFLLECHLSSRAARPPVQGPNRRVSGLIHTPSTVVHLPPSGDAGIATVRLRISSSLFAFGHHHLNKAVLRHAVAGGKVS